MFFAFKQINKFALSSNDDKRMQPIDLLETYAYKKLLNIATQ